MFEVSPNSEVKDVNNTPKEVNDYKQIKSEEITTFDESQEFWDDFFDDEFSADSDDLIASGFELMPETGKQEVKRKEYYDDNGKLYRVGNELLSDNTYEINGYKYETDDKGRIISAEGTLHLKDREGRLSIKDSLEDIGKGDEKEGDDRGHLIGDQFDGSNGLENMIPQDADINEKDFRNFENELAKEVKDGKTVYYKVEPVYDGDSRRPTAIVVTYSIDGEESVRVFPNGKED